MYPMYLVVVLVVVVVVVVVVVGVCVGAGVGVMSWSWSWSWSSSWSWCEMVSTLAIECEQKHGKNQESKDDFYGLRDVANADLIVELDKFKVDVDNASVTSS